MADENGGKRAGLIERVREDAEDIKKLVKEKGKEEMARRKPDSLGEDVADGEGDGHEEGGSDQEREVSGC